METIVVTGGAGFIGANFARHALAHTDARVVVYDKLTYAGNLCTIEDLLSNGRFAFVQGDIADSQAVRSLFHTYEPSGVVNFAAETHVDRSIDDPRPFIDTNIVGAFVLLETARKYLGASEVAARARFRFLQVSTDEVYGALDETGLFRETTPYAPNSPYSASKAAADHMARAYFSTYGVPVIITNCSNNYGPYQFPEKLIPLMTLNALEGKQLPIYGDGGNVRDWLYVEDHCSGILAALERGRPGEKYNIGGGNERTNLEVLDKICEALEEAAPACDNPALRKQRLNSYLELKTFVQDRPGHDRRYAIDAAKIRQELGWKPEYNLDLGIGNTVRWYLENRIWCNRVQEGKYQRERLGITAGE
jgi:dTDP-glucose 4,6-dehydratase